MEGDITRGEEFALFLNSEQWSRLCAFDPFDDYDRAVQDVIRELTFRESEEGDFLSITQVADRDVVHLLMHKDVAVHEVTSSPSRSTAASGIASPPWISCRQENWERDRRPGPATDRRISFTDSSLSRSMTPVAMRHAKPATPTSIQ
jgi:hypothetical protein